MIDADAVIGMYNDGYAVADVALALECTPQAVYQVLYRNGVKLRPRVSSEPDPSLDGLLADYFGEKREPIALVTARHGVSPGRLYRELAVRGLERRPTLRAQVLSDLERRLAEALAELEARDGRD